MMTCIRWVCSPLLLLAVISSPLYAQEAPGQPASPEAEGGVFSDPHDDKVKSRLTRDEIKALQELFGEETLPVEAIDSAPGQARPAPLSHDTLPELGEQPTAQDPLADRFVDSAKQGVFLGLNKVTTQNEFITIKETQRAWFGALTIYLEECWSSPAESHKGSAALVEITEHKSKNTKRTVFYGWMFSNYPSLHSLEHPVYDITLEECKF